MTTRQHGTRTKYVHDRCRCEPCCEANRAYARRRDRQRGYGIAAYVDAQPAREHLRALGMAGVGTRRVAELAEVSRSAIHRILDGRDNIRRETADAILAVDPDRAAGCPVDGTGTRRRLRALVAVGWSQQRLAAALGWQPGNFTRLITDDLGLVQPRTAAAVRDLYDRWWDTEPPCTSPQERGGVNRARRHAVKRGWPLPMAWDDDEIDDPAASPAHGDLDARRGVDLDEVAYLASTGAHISEIARRLGCGEAAIEKARERARAAA